MRVRRTPAIYTDAAFQIWKAQAENARNRYVNGELTYEELDALTQLPKKKGENRRRKREIFAYFSCPLRIL